MSKIRLCTIQDRRDLPFILDGSYKPDLHKSYAYEDSIYFLSYLYMLSELSYKTNKCFDGSSSCIWAWYQNPFLGHHVNIRNLKRELVAITFEADTKDVVFSDFDLWCDRVIDGKVTNQVVEFDKIKKEQCIQAVLWGIPRDKIISVESFRDFRQKYESLVAA